jgi:hypothetical protein
VSLEISWIPDESLEDSSSLPDPDEIAAKSLGVTSSPSEPFDRMKVKDAFGAPADHTVCCLAALGDAAEAKPFPGRFGLEEVCYEEHFGQPWRLGEGMIDRARR